MRSACRPPSREPADLWIERNVRMGNDSDSPGAVSFKRFPMVRWLLRKLQNPRTRSVVLMCSAQSAKTKTAEFFLIWKIKNDPAPTIWFHETKDKAREVAQARIDKTVGGCNVVLALWPKIRSKAKWWMINLDAMDLYIRGANVARNTESTSAQTVFVDERRNLPKGRMESIKQRYKFFRNPLEYSFSTAGIEFDDLHRAFLAGTQHFFHFACLSCGHRQPFRFGRDATTLFPKARTYGGVVWESNERTHPGDNVWNLEEVAKTTFYECENADCRRKYSSWEKPQLIATMTEEKDFGAVKMNPMATDEHISCHWNEMYMPMDMSFEKMAQRFLSASVAAHYGDIAPLHDFIQQNCGEPWRDASEETTDEDFQKHIGTYLEGQEFEDKDKCYKFLTVDVQKGHVVYVLRAWKLNGESRLIRCGKLLDLDELARFQKEQKVNSKFVAVDCAYDRADEDDDRDSKPVMDACARYGWKAFRGHKAKDFLVQDIDQTTGEQTGTIKFWKAQPINANIGTARGELTVIRYSWSKSYYRERFYGSIIKGIGPKWEVPSNVPTWYRKQIQATRKVIEINPLTKERKIIFKESGSHDAGDCELFQIVMKDIFRLVEQIA